TQWKLSYPLNLASKIGIGCRNRPPLGQRPPWPYQVARHAPTPPASELLYQSVANKRQGRKWIFYNSCTNYVTTASGESSCGLQNSLKFFQDGTDTRCYQNPAFRARSMSYAVKFAQTLKPA